MSNKQVAAAKALLREALGPRPAVGGFRIAWLGCQGIVHFEVDSNIATSAWEKLCDYFPRSGFWPFSVHGPDLDFLEEKQVALLPEVIIEEATKFPINEWFIRRKNQLELEFDSYSCVELATGAMDSDFLSFPGMPVLEVGGKAHILLVPVNEPWEAVAFVPVLETWNNPEINSPVIHAAVWRSWYRRWGAVPCFASYNSLLMKPAATPASWDELISLAWEHYSYCDDLLYEDIFSGQNRSAWTIADLANFIRRSGFWSFWWD